MALNSPVLTGDVSGTIHSTSVDKLKGQPLASTAPTNGQTLIWNGSAWAPATPSTGGGGGANGLTYYLDFGTAADSPTTNLPGTPKMLGRTGSASSSTYTSGTLTNGSWTLLAGFVSESTPQDPAVLVIPGGLWDFNLWAFGTANQQSPTSIRAKVYTYDGSNAPTLIATSSEQIINTVSAQYSISALVAQTTITATTRIYVEIEARATANGHTATLQFGDGQPSHVHTSLPLVGGTGLWKNSSGVLQSPASLLVDADVDPAAAIAQSKINGLTAALAACLTTQQIAGLSTTAPAALTTAPIAGLSTFAARADHAHQLPSLGTLGAQAALTTSAPLDLTLGGTGANTAEAARNAMQGMQLVDWCQTSTVTGTYNAVAGTLTYGANGTTTFDTASPSVGDTVILTGQTTGSTPNTVANGPYVVTSVGSASTPVVLTRPAWFTGTVRNAMQIGIRYGANNSGTVRSVFGPATGASKTDVVVGTTLLTCAVAINRQNTVGIGGASMTGRFIFMAGTTITAPASFQAGVVLTTPAAHSIEWDGNFLYTTTTSAVRAQQAAFVPVPATATSAGVAGQIAFDGSNLYVCTATNTWRRATLTTF